MEILEKEYEKNPNIGRRLLSKITGVTVDRCRTFLRNKRKGINTESVYNDVKLLSLKTKHKQSESQYKSAVKIIEELSNQIDNILQIKNAPSTTQPIELKSKTKKSEAIPVILFSDWHIEKTVEPESVNYKNFYNLEEAERTVHELFRNAVYLITKEAKYTNISQAIFALLGDLIDGYIHEENMIVNSLSPIESSIMLVNLLESGFKYVLDNTNIDILVPCIYGNHSRTSAKMMFSCGYKTNFEYAAYCMLANRFKDEKRIQFVIPKNSEVIIKTFDWKIRFYHGFNIKYNGGVGGITIPLNKAIARGNTCDSVDLDCIGHFHTFQSSGNFIVNGSAIGFDNYALTLKLPYEAPSQTFFLMDKDHKRTVTTPIFINRKKLI